MSKKKHTMQPQPSHDESVRQDFVTDLRAYITDEIYSLITPHYEKNIEPEFFRSNDRKPEDKSEVKTLMLNDRGYQSWSLLQRLSQQMMFTSVIDTVERNLDSMINDLDKHQAIGSLEIDELILHKLPQEASPRILGSCTVGSHAQYCAESKED